MFEGGHSAEIAPDFRTGQAYLDSARHSLGDLSVAPHFRPPDLVTPPDETITAPPYRGAKSVPAEAPATPAVTAAALAPVSAEVNSPLPTDETRHEAEASTTDGDHYNAVRTTWFTDQPVIESPTPEPTRSSGGGRSGNNPPPPTGGSEYSSASDDEEPGDDDTTVDLTPPVQEVRGAEPTPDNEAVVHQPPVEADPLWREEDIRGQRVVPHVERPDDATLDPVDALLFEQIRAGQIQPAEPAETAEESPSGKHEAPDLPPAAAPSPPDETEARYWANLHALPYAPLAGPVLPVDNPYPPAIPPAEASLAAPATGFDAGHQPIDAVPPATPREPGATNPASLDRPGTHESQPETKGRESSITDGRDSYGEYEVPTEVLLRIRDALARLPSTPGDIGGPIRLTEAVNLDTLTEEEIAAAGGSLIDAAVNRATQQAAIRKKHRDT